MSSYQRHVRRAELDPTKPLHITLRVAAAVAALRTETAYRARMLGVGYLRGSPVSVFAVPSGRAT